MIMFAVIIAGSRDFDDYDLLKQKCDFYLQNRSDVMIISGNARGADQLGERYAQERNLPCNKFPADWDLYGKRAGYLRNVEMAEHAHALIVFTNGSRGTAHMIKTAQEKNLLVRIVNF